MPSVPTIVYVLGPPGSGKGTQCIRLTAKYRCCHLSVGDVLRTEASDPNSPHRTIIQENMRLGRVGPKEITVAALKRGMSLASSDDRGVVFLDGFARRSDQDEYFATQVSPATLVVVFECSRVTLIERLGQRNREDDNPANIDRRLTTFSEVTGPVVAKYEALGKVVRVRADQAIEEVSKELEGALNSAGVKLELRRNEEQVHEA